MYQLEIDRERGLIRLTARGPILYREAARILDEHSRAILELAPRHRVKILVDTREIPVLTADVGALLVEYQRFAVARGVWRIAHVLSSEATRFQAVRLSRESGIDAVTRHFPDEAAAHAWLLSP